MLLFLLNFVHLYSLFDRCIYYLLNDKMINKMKKTCVLNILVFGMVVMGGVIANSCDSVLQVLDGVATGVQSFTDQQNGTSSSSNTNYLAQSSTSSTQTSSYSYASPSSNNVAKVASNTGNTKREELGYGAFAIVQDNGGVINRTIYQHCPECYGKKLCSVCQGAKTCFACKGRGKVGTNITCECARNGVAGICSTCQGTGNCMFCATTGYPGYAPHRTQIIGKNGAVLSDDPIDYYGRASSKSSSKSSSSSSRGTCSKCKGQRYDSTPYTYAASASTANSMPPYHHNTGSSCSYCTKRTDHYHYPCSECHGFGHN